MTAILTVVALLFAYLSLGIFRKKWFFILFFLVLFFTEFYWIEVFDAYLKPFYLVSVATCVVFGLRYLPVLKSKIIGVLFAFFIIQGLYLFVIGATFEEWKTWVLLFFFITISFNTASALWSKSLAVDEFAKLLLISLSVIVVFGLLQVLSYNLGIYSLSLRGSHSGSLQSELRYSAFFTEPDNCGKFIAMGLLILFPFIKQGLVNKWLYLFLTIGFLLDMTRSAIIGYAGAIFFGALIVGSTGSKILGSRSRIIINAGIILVVSTFAVGIISHFLGVREVFEYRFGSILKLGETLQTDAALPVRKLSVEAALRESMSSTQSFLFGKGWGAGYQLLLGGYSEYVKGSSNLYTMLLLFSGIFGLMVFLWIFGYAIKVLIIAIKKNVHPYLATGVICGILFSMIVGILSPNFIAPEFWMLLGLAGFIELELKRERSTVNA